MQAAATMRSVNDLLRLHRDLEGGALELKPSTKWAYRGQPRPYGCLIPSLRRGLPAAADPSALVIEEHLTKDFRANYALLQSGVPPGASTGVDTSLPQAHEIGTGFDLRCWSVMQHYDVPTRLLDWSANLWIACFFACATARDSDGELWFYDRALFRQDPAVVRWMRDFVSATAPHTREPSLDSAPGELVELDIGLTPRMRRQLALHTVARDSGADHAVLLANIDGARGGTQRMCRVIISTVSKPDILEFLDNQFHISPIALYPDIVGLSAFLRSKFERQTRVMLGQSAM
jgi:hypothetical protein